MNKDLLTLINKKNDKYRDWKSTNNDIEHKTKKKLKHLRELQKKILKKQSGIIISKLSRHIKMI